MMWSQRAPWLLPLVVGSTVIGSGCNCRPTLPPPQTTESESQSTAETASTADTAPEPPCRIPELEPNNSLGESNALVFEQGACGVIDVPLDLDVWSFTHVGSWLEIDVDAAENAFTDPSFVLSPVGEAWAALREDDPESVNATLRLLAPPGEYQLIVGDQDLNGGDRYGYDLRVSEAKPPVEWNREEAEPNENFDQAETVSPGDRIFGTMDNGSALPDIDFYVISIPAGKHALKIDIDAYEAGSSADLTVYLYDQAHDKLPPGCREPCAIRGGTGGGELDPLGEYDSAGSEIVYVQVVENSDQEGPANWYVLAIDLEA